MRLAGASGGNSAFSVVEVVMSFFFFSVLILLLLFLSFLAVVAVDVVVLLLSLLSLAKKWSALGGGLATMAAAGDDVVENDVGSAFAPPPDNISDVETAELLRDRLDMVSTGGNCRSKLLRFSALLGCRAMVLGSIFFFVSAVGFTCVRGTSSVGCVDIRSRAAG